MFLILWFIVSPAHCPSPPPEWNNWINKRWEITFSILPFSPPCHKNVVTAFFTHHQSKTVWSTAGSPWNQKCREWPWLQEANIQIPGKACVLWSRIIPITPVTQKHRKQREKSCLLCHSWDRFIIQAKANFDKQLGTISPNLWVILRNIQSTIRGGLGS